MQCRKCGTTIADKALICYKCGTATTDAKYQPYVESRSIRPATVAWVVAAVLALVLLAWFLLHSSNRAAFLFDRTAPLARFALAAHDVDPTIPIG